MSFRDHASNIMDNLIASVISYAVFLAVLKLWPRVVTKLTALRPTLLRRRASATPEPLPPGTSSAIVTAMQPPINRSPMMPTFVNSSMVMHWQAAQQQQAALAAHFPTMPRFGAATLQIN